MVKHRVAVLSLCGAALTACNPGSAPTRPTLSSFATPSKAPPPAATTNGEMIAQHLPRLAYRGGPLVRQPRIVTITFQGDDPQLVSRLERFGDSIAHTSWWRAVTEGYCVKERDCIGAGRPGFAVRLEESLPAAVHSVEISAMLRRHAKAGHFGPIDPDTVLLVYLPPGVRLKDAFVARYCGKGPHAYHRALRFDQQAIGYAVIPRCSDEAALTGTASHELLEMATNPDTAKRGFAFVHSSATLGFTAAGIEAMDPCGIVTQENTVVDSGFALRRAWSNRSAAQGRDPCVPDTTGRQPYLALLPSKPTVRLAKDGDSISIPLTAAADRPVESWTVAAFDLTGLQEREHYVDVSLDKTLVTPGDEATLTIVRRKEHPRAVCIVGLKSTRNGYSYFWPVAVSTR